MVELLLAATLLGGGARFWGPEAAAPLAPPQGRAWLDENTRGDYVRVRVKHDIRQALTKYVSIVRAKERQVYLVRYEKLARFCKMCGLIGHDHKECGLGIHDEKSLKFGDWIYVDVPSKPRTNTRTNKVTDNEPKKAKNPKVGGTVREQEPVDPEVADTASSPVKTPGERMEVDKTPKKRLNMDEDVAIPPATPGTSKVLLALTDGSVIDLKEGESPTNSNSSSKRLKVTMDNEHNEISAASR
ncbi:hypothetical protein D1007_08557 [Hordeum vulgare]|nr:hypothetical protein D1007_08557 [Hordeum vulgare]